MEGLLTWHITAPAVLTVPPPSGYPTVWSKLFKLGCLLATLMKVIQTNVTGLCMVETQMSGGIQAVRFLLFISEKERKSSLVSSGIVSLFLSPLVATSLLDLSLILPISWT